MNTKNLLSATVWCLYAVVSILLAMTIAFYLFGYFDYGYRYWYQLLDISEHLNIYAAQNTLKPQFHRLTMEEHISLFSQIVTAVHGSGEGLGSLSYRTSSGIEIKLLHGAEIQHLKDVAVLLGRVKLFALLILFCWPLLALLVLREGRTSWWQRSLGLSFIFFPLLVWMLVVGPTQLFYQLHEWIFPPNNPWFFYWEESHMSAMMKAPFLFGVIAVGIAVITVLLTPLIHLLGIAIALQLRTLFKAR